MPERFFLGLTTGSRPDFLFQDPTPTRTKRPESQEKEIREKREKRARTAPETPYAATVLTAVLLNSKGDFVFVGMSKTGERAGAVAARLVGVLEAWVLSSTSARTWQDLGISLFGLDIKPAIRIITADALLHYAGAQVPPQLPVGLWYHPPFEVPPWVDPHEMLVATELRSEFPAPRLAAALGAPPPPAISRDWAAAEIAYRQAYLAWQIAMRGGLYAVTQPATDAPQQIPGGIGEGDA